MPAYVCNPVHAIITDRNDVKFSDNGATIAVEIASKDNDKAVTMIIPKKIALALSVEMFQKTCDCGKTGDSVNNFKVIHTSPATPFSSINDLLDDIFKPKKVSGL